MLARLRRLPLPLFPAVAFLIAMLVFPLGTLFAFGFLEIDRGVVEGGFTLATYQALLSDGWTWYVYGRTLLIAVSVTVFALLLGYPIAYLYTRVGGLLRVLLLVAVLAPLLTSELVRTFAWVVLLGGRGAVNELLQSLGLIDTPIRFILHPRGVIIGMTTVLLPLMVVPLIASLQTVSHEINEAAENLGARSWDRFWRITVPQTVPGIAAGCTLVFVLAFSEFTVAILLGGATFAVASISIFENITTLLNWNRGAAIASLMLLFSFSVIVTFNVLVRRLAPWAYLKR